VPKTGNQEREKMVMEWYQRMNKISQNFIFLWQAFPFGILQCLPEVIWMQT
jgi:hypothetical protein